MPPIGYHEITQEHLKEENLGTLNSLVRRIVEELHRQMGLLGPVAMQSDIDMQGHRVINMADPQSSGDAVSKNAADGSYVTSNQLSKTVESTGTKILQTTRRLNDPTQREQNSSFLNDTGIGLAQTNTSTITVAASGSNSIITLAAGSQKFSDGTVAAYPQRQDTVANPGSGSNFYYYYLVQATKTVGMIGPFTADTSVNRLQANQDGRSYLAVAQVNAGGGGSGGGGGGGTGGCCEIDSKFSFYPSSTAEGRIEPCEEWAEIDLADGRRLCVAMNTLVSTFTRAQELQVGALAEVEGGTISKVVRIRTSRRASHKVVMKTEPGHVYFANGIRVHNVKL